MKTTQHTPETTAEFILEEYHRYKEKGDSVGAFTMKRVLESLPAEEVDAAIAKANGIAQAKE